MYIPVKRISNAFSEVLFPSFSSIQNDLILMKKYFLKSTGIISMITFPLMTILFFQSDFILHNFIGHKWDDSIVIIKILCAAGALFSIDISLSLFPSINKAELNIYLGIIRIVIISVAIIIGVKWGVIGIAFSITISRFIITIINYYYIMKNIKLTLFEILKSFEKPVYTSFLIISFSLILNYFIAAYSLDYNILLFILYMIVTTVIILTLNRKNIFNYYTLLFRN
jgi:PST family polysaccharide transporter